MFRNAMYALVGLLVAVSSFEVTTHAFAMYCVVSPRLVQTQSVQEGHHRLVVVFHGLGGQADTQLGQIQDWYLDNGFDVLQIRTGGKKYDPDEVAEVAAVAIKDELSATQYEHVVLDGISLGGRAAIDTLQLLECQGYEWSTPKTILLEGAPMTWRSIEGLAKYGAAVVGLVPFGPVANMAMKSAMSGMFSDPKPENVEPGVDREALEQSVVTAKHMPFSLWAGQLGSFASRGDYGYGTLSSLIASDDSVVFVWFRKDHEVVDQETAVQQWRDAFASVTVEVTYADATHCGFGEAPGANIAAHKEALRHVVGASSQ